MYCVMHQDDKVIGGTTCLCWALYICYCWCGSISFVRHYLLLQDYESLCHAFKTYYIILYSLGMCEYSKVCHGK